MHQKPPGKDIKPLVCALEAGCYLQFAIIVTHAFLPGKTRLSGRIDVAENKGNWGGSNQIFEPLVEEKNYAFRAL